MGIVISLLQILKDVGLLIVSSLGLCTALACNFISKVAYFVYHALFSRIYSLFYTFVWSPIYIIVSNSLQLVLLPVNIPLRIIAGTSMQSIIGQANTWTNGYVITTISQYALVILVFGVTIGAICGVCLGFVHSVMKIPDIVVDIPILFWKRIPSLLRSIRRRLPPGLLEQSLSYRDDIGQMPTPSPSIPPPSILEPLFAGEPATPGGGLGKGSFQRHSTSSKESVMEMASKLPSDFFQQKNAAPELKQQAQTYYQSPAQSPQNITLENSSPSSTSLWDQFDELPSTLRTEGGLSTLYSRRPFTFTSRGDKDHAEKLKRGQ